MGTTIVTVCAVSCLFCMVFCMVQYGYDNDDRMHRFIRCALFATKKTSAMVSIYMCCMSNCKHDT